MIATFRISKDTIGQLPSIEAEYLLEFNSKKRNMDSSLKSYVYGNDGTLDGDAIQESWFPTDTRFDFFISHAHDDEKEAKKLASWLHTKFHLTSFIDSQIWGSADSLQKHIDCSIREKTQKNITYKQTQDSSAHVHAMLTMALMDAIDKSNFFIFIESEQSLRPFEPDVTNSPWLFEEIFIANHIRRPVCKTICFSETGRIDESRQDIVHTVKLNDYPMLTPYKIRVLNGLEDLTDVYNYLLSL